MRGSLPIVAAVALGLLSCSDAPRDVPASQQPRKSGMPPDHPTLPADHPPIDQPATDPSIEFSGRARLVGELAAAKGGFVFFSVRPRGTKGPLLTYRIDLADPKLAEPVLTTGADGVRELHFVLNQRTSMMPGDVPRDVEVELQALYDPDGDIDSKDGRYEAVVPVQIGASDIVLEIGAPAGK
jgi:hypothetical protein